MKIRIEAASGRLNNYKHIFNKCYKIKEHYYYSNLDYIIINVKDFNELFEKVFDFIEHPIIYEGLSATVSGDDYEMFKVYDDYIE